MSFSLFPPCWASANPWKPINNSLLYSGGSHEQKSPLSSRAGVFGVHNSDGSLKKWEVNVGSKLLTRQERSLELQVPSRLHVSVPGMGFMVRLPLSLFYPLHCGYIFISLIYRNCSASFWISFSRNCSVCSQGFSLSIGVGCLLSWTGILLHCLNVLPVCELIQGERGW